MLCFKPISLDIKPQIDKYYFKFGEGSCQHSFTANFCMNYKYGDMYCEKNNYLYVLRSKLCDEKNRVYLFPMGSLDDYELKVAIDNVINDAHECDKKVVFSSITENAKNKLSLLYNEKFHIVERRDLYEYIYKVEDLAYLQGSKYYNKRNEVKAFLKKYDTRLKIKEIGEEDIENIKKLSKAWLEFDENRMGDTQLQIENRALNIVMDYYDRIGIKGLVIYIDNDLAGFIVGVKLNDKYMDALIEKGNIHYKGIYKVLNKEFARICCVNYKYLNLEEDLGVEGLRNMKLLYHPYHYIQKYVAEEK